MAVNANNQNNQRFFDLCVTNGSRWQSIALLQDDFSESELRALRNEIRGLLSEFGLLLPVGIRHVRKIQQGILPRGSGMTLHPFVVRTVRVK